MPILTVTSNEIAREVRFTQGPTLRELLEAAGIWVRSGCRGNGACGLCLVEIDAGEVPEPTKNELLLLSGEQLQGNTRLACQIVPEGDLRIRIAGGGPKSDWRELTAESLACTPPRLPARSAKSLPSAYGLAVDVGTTHISLSLWDLQRGERLSSLTGANPQAYYGSDVVTRLIAARESAENAHRIARITIETIREAFVEMCLQNGLSPAAVGRVVLVGNTAMLALLTETDAQVMLEPSLWTRWIDCRLDRAAEWVNLLGLDRRATVEMVPPCGGFVGSDLLAGVLATGLTDEAGAMLIDFGTNSEMALWDGDRLWVTSAAGGPAFDGCGMQCGMPAERGAVYRVDRPGGNGELRYAVIGGGEADGICGSGLVDLVACLRDAGQLTPRGKFSATGADEGFVLRRENRPLRLSLGDVDMFQRAKGAIGAGLRTLLEAAGIQATSLCRVYVGGVFGQHLDCRNAQAIGLLPNIATERVQLCGNTALAGCERVLLAADGIAALERMRQRATVINLSQSDDFERLFLESLYLKPMQADQP